MPPGRSIVKVKYIATSRKKFNLCFEIFTCEIFSHTYVLNLQLQKKIFTDVYIDKE